jgi:hypothetical protein
MSKRKNPTSVTVKAGKVKPMKMKVLRKDFGWEIEFNYDSGATGDIEIYDAADQVIDASEVQTGDQVSILLNVADWELTEDNVKDAIEAIK